MKSFNRSLSLAVAAWVLAVAAGCASAPIQEMSDARQAVQAARDTGAAVSSVPPMQAAEAALGRAEHALVGGDYEAARREAVTARNQAVAAREAVLAITSAREALARADAAGYAWRDTAGLVANAEAALAQGDIRQAVALAALARAQGEQALRQAGREAELYRSRVPVR